MNKRILIAVLAAVLAGLGIVSLVVWANGARDRAFSGTETVTVYQSSRTCPPAPMPTPSAAASSR